jgi:hypothetical protein
MSRFLDDFGQILSGYQCLTDTDRTVVCQNCRTDTPIAKYWADLNVRLRSTIFGQRNKWHSSNLFNCLNRQTGNFEPCAGISRSPWTMAMNYRINVCANAVEFEVEIKVF